MAFSIVAVTTGDMQDTSNNQPNYIFLEDADEIASIPDVHSRPPARSALSIGRAGTNIGSYDRILVWALTYAACAIALSWIAIANGFPLLFSDTGTYLRVSTELYLPEDRPPYYGLLIFPFYWAFGLWGVVIAQALIICWILDETMLIVIGSRSPAQLVATVSILSIASGLSWFSGLIMPDAFTGIAPLAVFVILFGDDHWRHRWLAPAVLLMICMIHLSHMPLALGTIILIAPIAIAAHGWREGIRRALRAAAAVAIAVLLTSSANLAVGRGFHPSNQSSRFLLARLLDAGLAQPVIRKACATRPMMICELADHAGRDAGQLYLWGAASPLPEMQRLNPGQLAAEEHDIVWQTLSSRPTAVFGEVLSAWGRQLRAIDPANELDPWPGEMQISRQIEGHFAGDAGSYHRSLQQHGTIGRLARTLQGLHIAILPLMPLLVWLLGRRGHRKAMALYLTVTAGVVLNALVCSALSGVFDRYQGRIEWLLTFCAIVSILALGGSPRSAGRAATAAARE